MLDCEHMHVVIFSEGDAVFVENNGFWHGGEGQRSPFRMSPFIQVQCIMQNKGAFITAHLKFGHLKRICGF